MLADGLECQGSQQVAQGQAADRTLLLRRGAGLRCRVFMSPGRNKTCLDNLSPSPASRLHSLSPGRLLPFPNLKNIDISLHGWRVRGDGSGPQLLIKGHGEKGWSAPVVKHTGTIPRTVPEQPRKFQHRFVPNVLQATEWVLQAAQGPC